MESIYDPVGALQSWHLSLQKRARGNGNKSPQTWRHCSNGCQSQRSACQPRNMRANNRDLSPSTTIFYGKGSLRFRFHANKERIRQTLLRRGDKLFSRPPGRSLQAPPAKLKEIHAKNGAIRSAHRLHRTSNGKNYLSNAGPSHFGTNNVDHHRHRDYTG